MEGSGLGLSITPEQANGERPGWCWRRRGWCWRRRGWCWRRRGWCQEEIDCATSQDAGESDEVGEIHYGLGEAQRSLVAGSETGRCLYRVHHGNTQAGALVRVVQIAGLPADDDDASLTRIGGLEPPFANRAQAPLEWNTTQRRRFACASDANGNPAAGSADGWRLRTAG